MSTSSRLSPVNIPGLCVLALLSTVSLAKVQSQVTKHQSTTAQTPAQVPAQPVPPDQVHPITGLPLPPDDPNYVAPPPEPKPITRAEKLAAARKAATVAANARIAAAKEAAAAKAAERAAAKEAADRAAAEKVTASKEAADKTAAEKAAAKPAPADNAAATPAPPASPKPKHLTKAQRSAAARQAAREAAAEKAVTAKAVAQQAAANRAAARKAAADKLAADKAATAEKNEAARAAAAEKTAADKAIADKAASDKAVTDKAAAEERAAAAKNAADKLAADKAAARAAAADKAASTQAAADKLAADKAAARAAATEKAAADKAAKDNAAAEKAAADKAAAAERAALAKAAAEKAAADKLAARKAAADKLAAEKAAAKALADKAAADKASTEAEKAAAAENAAADKKAADAAAAEKAAAEKAATTKLAAEKAVAAKAAADKAAADRIAAEKALAAERAADDKKIAAKSSRIPVPTAVTMPSATVADPDANIGKPVPGRPTAVTMPTVTIPADPDAPATKPVAPTRSTVISPSVVAVQPPPTTKPQPAKPQPAATATAATAPAAAAPTSGVAAIVFLGAEPFTPAELTPLTGLTLGTDPKSDSIQKASQRLIDTGLFSNVSASYDLNGPLGTATFNLKPAGPSDLVRASFANFVWLTPVEIATALKPVPFYHGLVPVNGSLGMSRDIEAALSAALKARGINATISHTLVPPSALHPYTAMEFRVTDPDTILETAQVFDVPPTLIAKVLKAQDDAVKIPYNEGIAGTTLTDVLLGPARDAGYLGARLYRVDHKRKSTPSAVYVDYSARMEVGPVYTVRALNWTPSAIYTAADFKRDSALHIGDRPSPEAAAKTEAAILASYRAQGYLEATVASTYNLTPATGGIDYTFTATAGPQYHLHTLTVRGLGPQAKNDFDGAWTIQPGDIYNEDYLLNFLNNHRNVTSLAGYTFDYNRTIVPDTHDVDLTLTFKPAK
jgi:hypothetical protein